MRKIIGLGEVLFDVLPQGAKLGGAPANFAFHVSQFGYDAVAISAVGNDILGDHALKTFDDNGLKYIIPRVPYPTGTVNVTLDEAGVPTYTFTPDVAWDHIPFTRRWRQWQRRPGLYASAHWHSAAQSHVRLSIRSLRRHRRTV